MKSHISLLVVFFRYLVLVLTLIFLFTPILVLIVYSFSENGLPYDLGKTSLQWYRQLVDETELWSAFFNSFFIALTSSLICLIMSLFLLAHRFYGGSIKRVVPFFYSNLVIPETILGISLLSMFSYFNIEFGIKTIIISHTLIGLGLCIPILYNRYNDIDENIIQASYSLGASKIQTFTKIVIPIMRPALVISGVFSFILSFDDFILSYFVASKSTQTLSLYLISSLRTGIEPTVNALSLILITTTIALFILCLKRRRVRIVL